MKKKNNRPITNLNFNIFGPPECSECKKQVHDFEQCSFAIAREDEGDGPNQRLCKSCFKVTAVRIATSNENLQHENWGGKLSLPLKKRKRSYLIPDPDMAILKFPTKKPKLIPILKNGNSSKAALRLRKRRVTFANTCAYDAIVQSLAVAYADSDEFQEAVDSLLNSEANKTLELVKQLTSKKFTNTVYRLRGEVLLSAFAKEDIVGKMEH